MSKMTVIFLIVAGVLSGCGPGFRTLDMASQDGSAAAADVFNVKLNESLLTANQVYDSMAEVTRVAPNQNTIDEYDKNVKTALSDNHKVSSISAPMMMATANLASRFCQQTIDDEAAKASADRRLYGKIDFTKGVSTLSEADFAATAALMAEKLWGRSISGQELALFQAFHLGFIADLKDSEKSQSGATRGLILGVCTAFLASYENMSL